jgi:hypothetical protein
MENKEQPRLLSARVTELEKQVRLINSKLNNILLKLGRNK